MSTRSVQNINIIGTKDQKKNLNVKIHMIILGDEMDAIFIIFE
jgi:hypothetical protein